MAVCIRPSQEQATLLASTSKGDSKPSQLAEKLLVIHSYWRKEIQFSSGVTMGRLSMLQWMVHNHMHVGNANWTQWIVKKNEQDTKLGGKGDRRDPGGFGRRS